MTRPLRDDRPAGEPVNLPSPRGTDESARTLGLVRVALLAIMVIAIVGTGVELVLLEHTDETAQWIPLVLLAGGLIVIAWHALARSRLSVRVLQVLMAAYILAGVVGTVLHYRGNVEFELERFPDMGGLTLFREAIMGATPALAPGVMVQLGLLGLLYAFRHPLLQPRER